METVVHSMSWRSEEAKVKDIFPRQKILA